MPSTIEEYQTAIERLPEAVQAALKQEAQAIARKVAARAAQILRSKTHGTGRTADAIRVLDETDRKQWVINSPGHPDDPANLSIWLEYGTRYMSARAFMRPAADEFTEAYRLAMGRAAERAAAALLE